MTTNDATPREAIAEAMDERGKIARCIDKHGFDWGWDDATILGAADEVIEHLWQAADDPAVAEAGAKCHYRSEGGLLSDREFDALPETRRRMLTEAAAEVTFGAMTAILGPRPQGDGR